MSWFVVIILSWTFGACGAGFGFGYAAYRQHARRSEEWLRDTPTPDDLGVRLGRRKAGAGE